MSKPQKSKPKARIGRDKPKKYKRRHDAFTVKVVVQPTDETYTLDDVYNDMTIAQLKDEVEFATGIPQNIQRLSYLDEGELQDHTDIRSNDFVPGSTIHLKVWPMYIDLVEAVVANEVEWLFQLGVTNPSDYHTPASDYMTKKSRKAWLEERAFIALCLASHKGHEEMALRLIQSGADVNRCTPTGKTPLHLASAKGHGELVNMLLHHGADINAEDNSGNTALSVAERFGSKVCSRYLFQFQWQERAKDIKPSKKGHSLTEHGVTLPPINNKKKVNLKRPVTYDEWLGKQKEIEKKLAVEKKVQNEEDVKKKLEEEEKKKEETEKLGYEKWLAQREQEKIDRSPRHSSPAKNPSTIPDNSSLLPVHHDGALRVYLRSLGKSRAGVTYEDWLNEKEMEINQLVRHMGVTAPSVTS